MVKFSTDQLKREAKTIKDIEKRFVVILSKSIEDTHSINRAIRELDPIIFSQNHNWRDIITSLNQGEDELNPFRRIALVKYMQYLSSRQEIIKYLYSEKKKNSKDQSENNDTGSFKDTVILENTVFEPAVNSRTGPNETFERMPKGEAVTITLAPGDELELLLSRHECKISSVDNKLIFQDNQKRTYELINGRSVVGRDSVSTIMMEPGLRDISRMHIVIEKFDEQTIQVTDLSSHGTYIQNKYLETNTGS
ncbi:MAG: FHA domain-containing protein [Gammaproteobacteria bacterium]|jgi:hypothetical protein